MPGAGATSAAARPAPGLAAQASASASSVAPGSSVRGLNDTGSTSSPGKVWRADPQQASPYVRLVWPRRVLVSRVTLVQDTGAAPAVLTGTLTFSDGSAVLVRTTSRRATTVALRPRTVRSLRFTVAGGQGTPPRVALAEIVVDGDPALGTTSDPAAGGNLAVSARATGSAVGAAAANDGSRTGVGAAWTSAEPAGSWLALRWSAPRELAAVQILGARPSGAARSTVQRGRLLFSDGSTVAVGGIVADPHQPTTVAFLPRVTTSVRFEVLQASGTEPLSIAEIRAFRTRATPWRPTAPGVTPTTTRPARSCDPTARPSSLAVLCPLAGTQVGRSTELVVSAPGATTVSAATWSASLTGPSDPESRTVPAAPSPARLRLDLSRLRDGPFTVAVSATHRDGHTETAYLQLLKQTSGGTVQREPTAGPVGGRTLVYDEEFGSRLSVSRNGSGADYAAAKPNRGGAEDFGQAVFPDPAAGLDNLKTVGGSYLQMTAAPLRQGYEDPNHWGRTHTGAMLSSARGGGSGFAAQYGYFEARVLAPAAPGTWPAFWLLPNPVLADELDASTELDVVELYGQFPQSSCATTHRYVDGDGQGELQCTQRYPTVRAAMAWHTYGVKVMPTAITYYVDGRPVVTHRQEPAGDQPLFFMVNLALGGGWPIDLSATQDQVAMYVDYVRVYV